MRVRTPRRAWIVPPSRALWVPSHTVHEINMHGVVEMRSLYIAESASKGMPASCAVLDVTPQRVQMDYYVIGDRRDPNTGSSWSASWATAADSNTVHAVATPVGERRTQLG